MYGANIFNKRSRTAYKGCALHLVVGRGPNIDSPLKKYHVSNHLETPRTWQELRFQDRDW